MARTEPDIRRDLRIQELVNRCKDFEQKVDRYQDALIDVAAGCPDPETRASKALLG